MIKADLYLRRKLITNEPLYIEKLERLGLGVKKGRRIVITTFLPKRYFAKWQQDIYERFEQDSKMTLLTLEEFIENM